MLSRSPSRLDPAPGASRKRKDREAAEAPKAAGAVEEAESALNSQLLAGYLAHEFLTRGTLLGQRWDPARAGAEPVVKKPNPARGAADQSKTAPRRPERYADVALLMKTDGAHLPGIVNPAQLARWLQM